MFQRTVTIYTVAFPNKRALPNSSLPHHDDDLCFKTTILKEFDEYFLIFDSYFIFTIAKTQRNIKLVGWLYWGLKPL